MNLLKIAPSPHVAGKHTTQNLMVGVLIALLPAWAASVYYFGWGAILISLVSIASCITFEYLIQKYLLKQQPTVTDGSAILTGLLLAFNLPSNLPTGLVILGAFVAIGVAKMTFGGLGNNPFNPALVGRVFLLISFPVQMTSWPLPTGFSATDVVSGATPLGIMKNGLKAGETVTSIMEKGFKGDMIPSHMELFYGHMGGSMGEVAAILLILGGLFMIVRKIISWHIPVFTIGTIALFTGILHYVSPDKFADPLFHLLTGGVMLGAFYMATDYVTSPMSVKGMAIFGIGIGVITVVIRVFGVYPEGISFAILIMNAFVPLINANIKPKRFGEEVKNG